MAYFTQAQKKEVAVALKKEFGTDAKKRGFKYSLSVNNSSTVVMRISAGDIDFITNYMKHPAMQMECQRTGNNTYPTYLRCHRHSADSFTGKVKSIMARIIACLDKGNYDNSDAMTDYFDVGWYVSICIGDWDKPYILQGA